MMDTHKIELNLDLKFEGIKNNNQVINQVINQTNNQVKQDKMNANNKVCCGFCDNNLGNEVGHTMDNNEVWCDDCYEDKTEQCDDCTELFRQGTLIQVVIHRLGGKDTVLDFCAHCHSIPRCPDCDDQLSKRCDFECDCGWFDKSRVWVCGHCGDTISNDITKCGCPNSEDSDDDTPATIIDCSVCKRCIDMDKDAFHNIERIAPDADGNVPVMNLCTYCWDLVGDAMLNNGWTNDL